MATDMADDDKMAEQPKPIEPPASEPRPAEPRHPSGGSSEWTASDGRGPLEKAEDVDLPVAEAAAPHEASAHRGPSATSHIGFGPKPESDASVAPPAGPRASAEAVGAPTSGVATTPSAVGGRRGRSLWPIAAAIVAGALVGAGSAYVMYGVMPQGSSQDPQVASLSARVDALEKRPDPQATVARVEASVAALSSKVAALRGGGLAPAGETSAPAASTPAVGKPETSQGGPSTGGDTAAPSAAKPAVPAADLGPLNQKIAALQADLDTLKTQGADTKALKDKVAELEGALAGIKTATAAAQAGVTTVQGEQKSLAGRVMAPALAVVADSLVQQIQLGQPFAGQVDALVALGADPAKVAVLRQNAEKGVPSAKTLAAKFEPFVEPIEATAQKPPPNAGFMDRLKSGALSIVSIRRADDTSGDDLPSRVARIKAALAHDDVPGALMTWEALPADAKAKSTAWGTLAKIAAEAMTAARALQQDSIAALAAKKS